MRAELRPRRTLAALALGLGLVAAGCGSGGKGTIKIGVISDCRGVFSAFYDQTLAGAELPLILRGGKLKGPRPSDGLEGASVAGKRVELLLGCEDYLSPKTTLAEARRLVEHEGAGVLVAPGWEGDGLLIRDYAKRRPRIVFSAASMEPETTLKEPAPNLFRFNIDAAQTMAGLGGYAYHELGWRNVVTFGEDDPSGWPVVAGFVAEFCSLGGNIVKRLWGPSELTDWSPVVAQIPSKGVDGVLMASSLQGTRGFFEAYGRLHRNLSRQVLASGFALILAGRRITTNGRPSGLSNRLLGVVAGDRLPFQSPAPAWVKYLHDFQKTFPGTQGGGAVPYIPYYNAMEAVLEALEHVHGDLSQGERRLMAALRGLQLDAPDGRIRLDANRQAIGPNYLSRVARDGRGRLVIRTFRSVPDVEQTFNGYFSATSPAASRIEPRCRRGNPPPWAR